MIEETFQVSLRAVTMAKLEPMLRAAAEAEWESEIVQLDLIELANDLYSRLQRIGIGDVQPQSGD